MKRQLEVSCHVLPRLKIELCYKVKILAGTRYNTACMCAVPYTGTTTGVATTQWSPIRYPPSQGAPLLKGLPLLLPQKDTHRGAKKGEEQKEEEEEGENYQGAGGQAVAQADMNSIT